LAATRHESAPGSDDFIQQLERTYAVRLRAKPLSEPRKRPSAASPPTSVAIESFTA
jgi:hypothetical protein